MRREKCGDIQEEDADHDDVEHGLGTQTQLLLDPPEAVDADGLGGDAYEEKVG